MMFFWLEWVLVILAGLTVFGLVVKATWDAITDLVKAIKRGKRCRPSR